MSAAKSFSSERASRTSCVDSYIPVKNQMVKVMLLLSQSENGLGNAGCSIFVINNMGEQWVMLESITGSMKKYKKCVRSKWKVFLSSYADNTFTRIADKWGKLLDVDDQDETCFHSKRFCVYLKARKIVSKRRF
ncbi:hypothetical protein Tco_0150479 [Tanacetum coccineum]